MKMLYVLLAALLALLPVPVQSAGTIPPSGQQNVDVNGKPLAGCLLYIFQAGTVATPQNAFSDPALTQPLPNPMQCDQSGRLPFFYLADGSVHVRLTDASGVVIYDYPAALVIGPSAGGGGSGGFDPTAVSSTGDVKWRASSEILSGWVRMNALTIGSASSGATGRANPDTQNLFVYLWINCSDTNCPVSGGRGANALADFNAPKTIQAPDMRGIAPYGLDGMGNARAGNIPDSQVVGGTGDTPGGFGGASQTTIILGNLPAYTPSGTVAVSTPAGTVAVSTPTGAVSVSDTRAWAVQSTGVNSPSSVGVVLGSASAAVNTISVINTSGSISAGFTGNAASGSFTGNAAFGSFTGNAQGGTSLPLNTISPFRLGSWYIKL